MKSNSATIERRRRASVFVKAFGIIGLTMESLEGPENFSRVFLFEANSVFRLSTLESWAATSRSIGELRLISSGLAVAIEIGGDDRLYRVRGDSEPFQRRSGGVCFI
jgi:hypothetical protein